MSTTLRTRNPNTSLLSDLLAWDPFYARSERPTPFAPAFEVKETAEAFILKADLPGVAEADLDINVHNNVLTVSGTRHAEDRKEGESYALYERQFGSFSRSFALSEIADGERIEAKLEHGVLTLTIAKKAEAKPRKISVSTTAK